jgi:murein DD-endopeptidase MepM/ murein hydrolase activator NlpD
MPEQRTFKVTSPPMKGKDVKEWQELIKREFKHLKINCPIKPDGIYGVHTRSYSSSLLIARGILVKEMEKGVTPALRSKIRKRELTKAETKRFHSVARVEYRKKLRDRWAVKKVHKPVSNILADSWGYHPGVHDGIDVICKPNAAVYSMVKCKVIDVRASGWWGNNPSGDVSKGDGIVQVEVLENVGPFKKGFHIGYGHCEHARVKVGEVLQAGEVIALAGLAVAWHVHLMYNDGSTNKGIGNRDPQAILDYSIKHG